jgi:hypothetical protein
MESSVNPQRQFAAPSAVDVSQSPTQEERNEIEMIDIINNFFILLFLNYGYLFLITLIGLVFLPSLK